MKQLLDFLRRRFQHGGDGGTQQPIALIDTQVDAVRQAEDARAIEPGKLIHAFPYRDLDLRLDREVTGLYRITVNEGKERLYSFTIKTPPGDYDGLRAGYREILRFLDGDRAVMSLPDLPGIKGHYYGPPT